MSIPPPGESRHGVMRDLPEIEKLAVLLSRYLRLTNPEVSVMYIHGIYDCAQWVLGHDVPGFKQLQQTLEGELRAIDAKKGNAE
jgi:hypothetical protein